VVNDRQDPYGQQGQHGQDGQIYGYDEYGRPLYHQSPEQPGYAYDQYAPQPPYEQQPGYDQTAYDQSGYARPGYEQQPPYGQQGYGYEQGTGPPPAVPSGTPPGPPGPPGQQLPHGYDYDYGTGQQPVVPPPEGYAAGYGGYEQGTGPQPAVPRAAQQAPPAQQAQAQAQQTQAQAAPPERGVPGQRAAPPGEREYHTEQFAFVEEDDTESEEVIDWLKFTESRTERREESKRRATGRRRLVVIALVLAVLGGAGYLWADGRLPFLSSGDGDGGGAVAESRDVIILHLRETGGDTNSTVLLVANETAGESTTLLLPNELVITPDGGTTTLGQAVQEEGAASVRDAVGTLLGAEIKGTWRLDTPYLENLVDLVGGITVQSDAEVPGEKDDDVLIGEGEQSLDGRTAVAYALYRAPEEPQSAQLSRFGQVMAGVLDKMPSSEEAARRVVENLAQIADPSLTEGELGASLAQLGSLAQEGTHTSSLLPVQEDGSISDNDAEEVVMAILGGAVSNADTTGTPRVALRDASGSDSAGETARIALVNGGWTVVDNKAAEDTAEDTEVRYGAEPFRETALEVARTLGIAEESVAEAETPGNADIAVIIGEDYGAD
jgi:anionic cell wall polymer biosynthesis LytR-Cps2A-Psr (LCP) family protein